ncbi:hypothetical protein MNBD_ALPHA11-1349 [hydrothermal vent metagenome]|uniref:Uncharacterized protein n=1 Tax=hydrothermal vent metagenome TaxID=652676 RepID=A0A3B0TAD8_9ZZZZ
MIADYKPKNSGGLCPLFSISPWPVAKSFIQVLFSAPKRSQKAKING